MSEAKSEPNNVLAGIGFLIMVTSSNYLFFNNWATTIGVFVFGFLFNVMLFGIFKLMRK